MSENNGLNLCEMINNFLSDTKMKSPACIVHGDIISYGTPNFSGSRPTVLHYPEYRIKGSKEIVFKQIYSPAQIISSSCSRSFAEHHSHHSPWTRKWTVTEKAGIPLFCAGTSDRDLDFILPNDGNCIRWGLKKSYKCKFSAAALAMQH